MIRLIYETLTTWWTWELITLSLKDNLPKKSVQEWTLSGKEAEALHLEEEDFSDQEDGGQGGLSDDEDPLQKIIQSRYCFIIVTCHHMSSFMLCRYSLPSMKYCYVLFRHIKRVEIKNLNFSGGGIPDAMAIHLARKKREAAREATGGKDDFIPIGTDGAPR